MGKYRISGIKIEYDYIFIPYFEGQIEKYQISDHEIVRHRIYSQILDEIAPLHLPPVAEYKSKKIYRTPYEEVIDMYRDGEVVVRITTSRKLEKISITMSTALGHETLIEYEYALTGTYFLSIALLYDMIALHAAAVLHKEEAILFSAPSGTGKSTHSRLWQKVFPDTVIINDDKPLISFKDGKVIVSSSPWCGKESINENVTAPLKAICFLKQSETNYVEEVDNNQKLFLLMKNIHFTKDEKIADQVLRILETIIAHIPIYVLHCNMEEESVQVIHEYLYRNRQKI